MMTPLRMEGVWTVGGTKEQSVWPKPSEQGREWCQGKLVKKAGTAGSYSSLWTK